MQLTSTVFSDGGKIPSKYTGDGPDVSPPLKWTGVPGETRSLVLIVDDPDAPADAWTHWVLYNIPPGTSGLSENVPKQPTVMETAKQGLNDFRRFGYGGPAPPKGAPHRYIFRLYAVDRETALAPGATKKEILWTLEGHVLAEAELMGTYQR